MTCPRTRGTADSHRAFTLIEVIVALAIIAIIFIALIPLAAPSLSERKLRHAMDDIVAFVRSNRLAAEAAGRDVLIQCHSDGLMVNQKSLAGRLDVPGVRMSIRFPGGKMERARGQVWRILPCGVVSPATVRVEDGDYWLEVDVDPLTGDIMEERYSL
ncbi:prepilin-type N-terminal cleavage/methylation domain-containing protein [Terrimicrobium sacchariphilum]|uniref:Prepilin-type N-terminal cleavage/methylation domain-containing protein n=2 Tax=Terrimicrobium sacchariphilum TaxID=690879 RepID=A0A146GBS1_TERSA|nr:prepilin-type N-terminal cleavage/methylation domain-containing protein [Terrimicrobium sacchariphilum]GAT34254.1 prepilin-type N-terminal cleavage/methylation domain-containing protein [Terrimicrobium sacchariphilum]